MSFLMSSRVAAIVLLTIGGGPAKKLSVVATTPDFGAIAREIGGVDGVRLRTGGVRPALLLESGPRGSGEKRQTDDDEQRPKTLHR